MLLMIKAASCLSFRRRGAGAGSTVDAQLDATRALLETGLVLENLCLTVVAREFLRKDSYWPLLTKRERWYGTAYETYAFDGASIRQLQSLKAPPRGGVTTPRPNPYLPRDVRIRAPPPEPRLPPAPVVAEDPTAPQPLAVGNGWTASYSTDREFGRPRGAVFANARVGAIGRVPRELHTGAALAARVPRRLARAALARADGRSAVRARRGASRRVVVVFWL